MQVQCLADSASPLADDFLDILLLLIDGRLHDRSVALARLGETESSVGVSGPDSIWMVVVPISASWWGKKIEQKLETPCLDHVSVSFEMNMVNSQEPR